MNTYVLDASVILKWIFPTNKDEDNVSHALSILDSIENSSIKIVQPVHWMAEVIAVVARLAPGYSMDIIGSLHELNFTIKDELGIYELASALSVEYKHHLFDTLYHAVALSHSNALFVTADDKYYKKSKAAGGIVHLREINRKS